MSLLPFFLVLWLVRVSSAYRHALWKVRNHRLCSMNSREGVLAGSFEQTFNKGLGKEGIVYADNDIIVVDKPANLQTAPGYIHKDCLARRVADLYDIERVDTMIVHRLDYATSGLVVFARSGAALRALNSQFRGKSKIFKSYIAIVVGQVQQSNGIVDLPIGKDKERGPPYYCIDRKSASARSAETHYSVIEQGATCAMVKLVPVTGRTHQLRLHMTALGHPILGDAFYGHAESADHTTKEAARNPLAHATHTAVPSESSAVAGIEDVRPVQRSVYERAERLLLHATELHLLHPTTGEVVKFTSPCPFTLHDYDTLSL